MQVRLLILLAMTFLSALSADSAVGQAQTSARRAVVDCGRFSGDLATKLTQCLAALPASGGVAELSAVTGRQPLSSGVNIAKPVTVRIGCAEWVMSAPIRVNSSDVEFESSCHEQSVLRRAPGYSGNFIAYAGTGFSELQISGIIFDNGSFRGKNQDASSIIYLLAGNRDTHIHHNRFVNLGGGRAIASGSYRIAQRNVRIENNTFLGNPVLSVIGAAGLVRQSGVVTVTTTDPHGFEPGQQFYLDGPRDESFQGVFTIEAVPSPSSLTYRQAGLDAVSGNGVVRITNLRAISLVSPGMKVRVSANQLRNVGGVTIEPSSEADDSDIEVCGNEFLDVDATNILIRAHDNVTVQDVKICDNRSFNAGLHVGKGCIAIGENTGTSAKTAVFRHATVTGNACLGWGNWSDASIGISVAGSLAGSTTQDVVIARNTLDARRMDGKQTLSGYGILMRNNTSGFEVRDNQISHTGRSCVATTGVSDGIVEENTCDSPVQWPGARNPDPAYQACYQIDRNSSRIEVRDNSCLNPGTPAASTNGYYVADTASVESITLTGNSIKTDHDRTFLLRDYSFGEHAREIKVERDGEAKH